MVALCADCGGMSAEELHRETLAVFGGRRLTNGMTDRCRVPGPAPLIATNFARLGNGQHGADLRESDVGGWSCLELGA
jgi:hypothetical protein